MKNIVEEKNIIRSFWRRTKNFIVTIFLISGIFENNELEIGISILLIGVLYVLFVWLGFYLTGSKIIVDSDGDNISKFNDFYISFGCMTNFIFIYLMSYIPWIDGLDLIYLLIFVFLLPSLIENNYNIYIFNKRRRKEKNESSRNSVKNKLKDVDLNDRI